MYCHICMFLVIIFIFAPFFPRMAPRLYLRGLPYGVSQSDLRSFLWGLGVRPQALHVVRRDLFKEKSSCFLAFCDGDDVDHFCGLLHGVQYRGYTLECQWAKERCLDKSWQVFFYFCGLAFLGFSSWLFLTLSFYGPQLLDSYKAAKCRCPRSLGCKSTWNSWPVPFLNKNLLHSLV